MSKRGAAQLRKVVAEHPELPMMVLAPSTPSDFDSWYHDVCGASVESVLKPDDVAKQYKDACGLNYERFYTDEDDAVEDVADALFDAWFDEALRHGMRQMTWDEVPSEMLTEFCGAEMDMADFSGDVARAMVRDMPWQDYVIIDCY